MRFLRKMCLAVLALALLEGTSCVLCAIMGVRKEPRGECPSTWYRYSPTMGWVLRPSYKGVVFGAQREVDEEGLFEADGAELRQGGSPVVLVVGDSCSFGYGIPFDQTYAEVLEGLLPGSRVINLSVVGYSSYQGLIALRRNVDRIAPSAIIVSFSWNDRRYVRGRSETDGWPRFVRTWLAQRLGWKLASISCAFRLLGSLSGLRGISEDAALDRPIRVRARGWGSVTVDRLCARVPPDEFRRNLCDFAEISRRRQIPLVFLLLVDNPAVTAHLNQAVDLIQAGGHEMAIGILDQGRRVEGWYTALASKYLAQALEETGRLDDSRRAKVLRTVYTSFYGGQLLYRDIEYREIMIDVAERNACLVCDAAPVLGGHPEWYLDECHFGEQGHKAVAQMLADVLRPRLPCRQRVQGPLSFADEAVSAELPGSERNGLPIP